MTSFLMTGLLAHALSAGPPPATPPAETQAAPAATQTVETTGQAAVVNGDQAAAIEQAREAALRDAVSQVAGTRISSETLAEGSILIHDRILARSSGYVKKWSYVGTPQVADGTATVKVKAEVGTAELDKDLEAVKAILSRKGKPRVVLLIAEQNVGMLEPFAWWGKDQKEGKGNAVAVDLETFENTFIETINKNGWVFVDRGVLEGKLHTEHAFSADLSNSGARELAKLGGAEVAIVGRVVAQSPGPSDLAPGMFAANANVSLRAINCDNGEVLDTVSMSVGDITTLDANAQNAGQKALRLAARQSALRLQQKILERWSGEMGGSARVTMKVSGIPNYKALRDFEGALSTGMRGVKSVQERNVDVPVAELDLELAGTPQMLASQLSGKTVKGMSVSVKHVSANELDVQLSK
jgi:hypothetical protein